MQSPLLEKATATRNVVTNTMSRITEASSLVILFQPTCLGSFHIACTFVGGVTANNKRLCIANIRARPYILHQLVAYTENVNGWTMLLICFEYTPLQLPNNVLH